MKIVKYITYQLSLVITALYKIGLIRLFQFYDKDSKNVLLVFPSTFITWINYLMRANILHDLSILYFFCEKNIKYRIVFSHRFGYIKNSNIYYSFSSLLNRYNFDNHSIYLYNIINLIEKQNNKLITPLNDILLWENKVYMHAKFDELDINSPKTLLIKPNNFDLILIENTFTYPFLIKEPFSNHSRGIYYINNRLELINQSNLSFKNVNSILIQEVIPMSRDARVVVLNNKIEYFYWRTKTDSTNFTTTSTSNGSSLDFTPLSEKNQNIIIEYTKKLNINMGAYDVTFYDNDENTKPIILEVSTSFLINPLPTDNFLKLSYSIFKSNSIRFGYFRAKAALDFKLKQLTYLSER
jgi:hypothetical protein